VSCSGTPRSLSCWPGIVVCLLLVAVSDATGTEGKLAVFSVQCPGEPAVRGLRALSPELNITAECRERVVAVIDVEAAPSGALRAGQAEAVEVIREKPGWPQTFNAFSGGSLTLADLGDPRGLATVVDMEDGTLHALAADGQPLPGWPVPLAATGFNAVVAAVDLLGDQRAELLIGSFLRVLSSEGELLPGWPFTQAGSAILVGARLIPDGPVRVVGAGQLPPVPVTTGGAFVLDEFGELLPGWPAVIPKGFFARPLAQGPAVGDVSGDGVAEVVVTVANESQLWVFDHAGATVEPFPLEFGIQMDDPSLGDLDRDGRQEIVFWMGLETIQPAIIALCGDGTIMRGWPQVRPRVEIT